MRGRARPRPITADKKASMTERNFYYMLRAGDEALGQQYAQARKMQADHHADEIAREHIHHGQFLHALTRGRVRAARSYSLVMKS